MMNPPPVPALRKRGGKNQKPPPAPSARITRQHSDLLPSLPPIPKAAKTTKGNADQATTKGSPEPPIKPLAQAASNPPRIPSALDRPVFFSDTFQRKNVVAEARGRVAGIPKPAMEGSHGIRPVHSPSNSWSSVFKRGPDPGIMSGKSNDVKEKEQEETPDPLPPIPTAELPATSTLKVLPVVEDSIAQKKIHQLSPSSAEGRFAIKPCDVVCPCPPIVTTAKDFTDKPNLPSSGIFELETEAKEVLQQKKVVVSVADPRRGSLRTREAEIVGEHGALKTESSSDSSFVNSDKSKRSDVLDQPVITNSNDFSADLDLPSNEMEVETENEEVPAEGELMEEKEMLAVSAQVDSGGETLLESIDNFMIALLQSPCKQPVSFPLKSLPTSSSPPSPPAISRPQLKRKAPNSEVDFAHTGFANAKWRNPWLWPRIDDELDYDGDDMTFGELKLLEQEEETAMDQNQQSNARSLPPTD